MIEFINIRSI